MIPGPSRILVLAPHTDDGEFGAGASAARWVSEGHDVHYVAFSACQTSVPDGWPEDVLTAEVMEATAEIGIPGENVRVLDYEVRNFARDRQAILQSMVDLNVELSPNLVVMPSTEDLHQDHQTVAQEGLRAFKRTSILAYEIPWNNLRFRNVCFHLLDETHVQTKVQAISRYRSQASRYYSAPDFLISQLRYRGTQVGASYAEAFDVVRWIL